MRRTTIIFFFSLLLIIILMSGCVKECDLDDDCTATGPCSSARCVKGTCQQLIQQGCCGNGDCDKPEENACSCTADCTFSLTEDGLCEGKVSKPDPNRAGKFIEARYAEYYCKENACAVGLPEDEVQQKQLLSSHPGLVNLEVVTTISQPFVIGDGKFTVRLRLTDITQGRAAPPVTITSIQVLSRNELIGEQTLAKNLTVVGDSFEEELFITPTLAALEEERPFSVRISYAFTETTSTTTSIARESLETTQATIPFIDPSKVELP